LGSLNCVSTPLSADNETKLKQEKAVEIKRLNQEISKVESEISKYEERLQYCLKYKEFLVSKHLSMNVS